MKTPSAQPSGDIEARGRRGKAWDERHQVGEENEAGGTPDDGEVALGALRSHDVLGDAVEVAHERFHERPHGELVVRDDRAVDVGELAAGP